MLIATVAAEENMFMVFKLKPKVERMVLQVAAPNIVIYDLSCVWRRCFFLYT